MYYGKLQFQIIYHPTVEFVQSLIHTLLITFPTQTLSSHEQNFPYGWSNMWNTSKQSIFHTPIYLLSTSKVLYGFIANFHDLFMNSFLLEKKWLQDPEIKFNYSSFPTVQFVEHQTKRPILLTMMIRFGNNQYVWTFLLEYCAVRDNQHISLFKLYIPAGHTGKSTQKHKLGKQQQKTNKQKNNPTERRNKQKRLKQQRWACQEIKKPETVKVGVRWLQLPQVGVRGALKL